MKKYVKPTIEFVELRPEERLARCVHKLFTSRRCCGWKGNCFDS